MNFNQQNAAVRASQLEEQRPFVRFETRAVEDRTVPSTDGVTRLRDEAWALVRAPGSRDTLEKLALDWLASLRQYAHDGRIPPSWPSEYQAAYDAWTKGEELPVNGTAIKTWPPLSPAQRKNILALGILTVEDLAKSNEEVLSRIGMGAHTVKQLANSWLTESKDKGSMAQSLEAALVRLAEAEKTIATQAEQIKQLGAKK